MAELTEDILRPLVRYLSSSPGLQSMHSLIPEGGVNPVLGPPLYQMNQGISSVYTGDPTIWIFRNFDPNGEPFANVEGTGSSAITLTTQGSWARRNPGSGLSFPEVTVTYMCDVTRDQTIGAPKALDAVDKCISLHKQVDRLLNLADMGSESFKLIGARTDGSHALRVNTSRAGRDLQMLPSLKGDSMVEATATYELAVFI